MNWPKSIKEIYKITSTENSSGEFILQVRWEHGLFCDSINCSGELIKTKKGLRCKKCKRDLSITSNTLFHRRKLNLSELIKIVWWIASQDHSINIKKISEMFNVHYPVIQSWVMKFRRIMMEHPKEIFRSKKTAICVLESRLFRTLKNSFSNKFLLAFTIEQPMKIYMHEISELDYIVVNRFLKQIGKHIDLTCSVTIMKVLNEFIRAMSSPFDYSNQLQLDSITMSFNDWFKTNYGRNKRIENIRLLLDEFSFYYNRNSIPKHKIFEELIKRAVITNSK